MIGERCGSKWLTSEKLKRQRRNSAISNFFLVQAESKLVTQTYFGYLSTSYTTCSPPLCPLLSMLQSNASTRSLTGLAASNVLKANRKLWEGSSKTATQCLGDELEFRDWLWECWFQMVWNLCTTHRDTWQPEPIRPRKCGLELRESSFYYSSLNIV